MTTMTTSNTNQLSDWREYQKLQKIVEVGPGFISYVDMGRASSEPLVFLHGIPTWGYIWKDVAPQFSKSQRVLIPDLMGFGFSSRADHFDRSIARQVDYLIEWMDAIELERASFIAHDIGGGVALRMAALHPERVDKLCLMNGVSYDSWPIELMLQLGHPSLDRALPVSVVQAGLRLALKQGGFETSQKTGVIDGILAPYATEAGKLSLIRNASALNTNLTTEISPLLPRLPQPTLIVWGMQDSFQPASYGRLLADDIPNATFVPIEKASHFVMLDQPHAVARQVAQFLATERQSSRKTGTAATRPPRRPSGERIRRAVART